jgi:hypothetical protein
MNQQKKEFKIDADNYTIKNLVFSAAATSFVGSFIINPLEVLKFRAMRDMKNCSYEHFASKSLTNTLLGKNKGPGPSCNNCLSSTNPFVLGKHIYQKSGFLSFYQGVNWSIGVMALKQCIFMFTYEHGKYCQFLHILIGFSKKELQGQAQQYVVACGQLYSR